MLISSYFVFDIFLNITFFIYLILTFYIHQYKFQEEFIFHLFNPMNAILDIFSCTPIQYNILIIRYYVVPLFFHLAFEIFSSLYNMLEFHIADAMWPEIASTG